MAERALQGFVTHVCAHHSPATMEISSGQKTASCSPNVCNLQAPAPHIKTHVSNSKFWVQKKWTAIRQCRVMKSHRPISLTIIDSSLLRLLISAIAVSHPSPESWPRWAWAMATFLIDQGWPGGEFLWEFMKKEIWKQKSCVHHHPFLKICVAERFSNSLDTLRLAWPVEAISLLWRSPPRAQSHSQRSKGLCQLCFYRWRFALNISKNHAHGSDPWFWIWKPLKRPALAGPKQSRGDTFSTRRHTGQAPKLLRPILADRFILIYTIPYVPFSGSLIPALAGWPKKKKVVCGSSSLRLCIQVPIFQGVLRKEFCPGSRRGRRGDNAPENPNARELTTTERQHLSIENSHVPCIFGMWSGWHGGSPPVSTTKAGSVSWQPAGAIFLCIGCISADHLDVLIRLQNLEHPQSCLHWTHQSAQWNFSILEQLPIEQFELLSTSVDIPGWWGVILWNIYAIPWGLSIFTGNFDLNQDSMDQNGFFLNTAQPTEMSGCASHREGFVRKKGIHPA